MAATGQLVDSCLLVNRKMEQHHEHSVTHTEYTTLQRKFLKDNNVGDNNMTQFSSQPDGLHSVRFATEGCPYPPAGANGHPADTYSSASSHVSSGDNPAATLLSRTKKQQTTQKVTTVTKVIREVHHLGPDGQPVEYFPYGTSPMSATGVGTAPTYGTTMRGAPYGGEDHQDPYGMRSPAPDAVRYQQSPYQQQPQGTYQDYEPYPPPVSEFSTYSAAPYPPAAYAPTGGQFHPEGGAAGGAYGDRPPTPPSPSDRSESPPTQQAVARDYLRKGVPFPPSGYDELDSSLAPPSRQDAYRHTPSPGVVADRYGVRWRDPDLHEVIEFLNNPNHVVKANAAAYLQHLCYMDDPVKQKTRMLGGIAPLVALLANDSPDVYRNACGALRNLSYGRQNDENKKAIKNAGGIPALIRLLRKTQDNEIKELLTGVLWNLSSSEDLKRSIIDDGLEVVISHVIIPHSGWDHENPSHETCWSTVFRNATGVLRNVSSAGEYARKKLRECDGLVDSLLHVVRTALEKSDIDDKCVENCVCVLRNLSYRCQEVEDPNYDRHPIPTQSRAAASASKGDNLGCFGASRKKKEAAAQQQQQSQKDGVRPGGVQRSDPIRGMELLWQPEVVQPYLSLLSNCSNPETLEAAAGALQNLAACYWQPSTDIRAAVRKEKGLPILVELLRMEVDRVVCAVATALRNLAIDQRNKELIGKYAMRDLVQKLPSGNPQHDQGTSDETISAVLATLNEVIKKNADFSRSLLEAGGVERLLNVTRCRQKYSPRVLKFASQVLYSMWQHQELREVYKKHGWKESDFVAKRPPTPSSPTQANNTLNRPMASQGGTRYEDKTMHRNSRSPGTSNYAPKVGEEVPLADMAYPDGGAHAPPPGGVRIYPPPPKPGEPVYAKVNREKKKNRQYDPQYDGEAEHPMVAGDGWVLADGGPKAEPTPTAGGDSWV